jgi:hypothetical protein
MPSELIKVLPEIIRESSKNPLGLISLVAILISFLSIAFFRQASVHVRVSVFLLLLLSLFAAANVALSPTASKAVEIGGVMDTGWQYAIVPKSGERNSHITRGVSVEVPRNHEIIPERVELTAGWAAGGGPFGWGNWLENPAQPQLSRDKTTASATYDNFKHDRAVRIGIRASYRRVWTVEDTILYWSGILSIAVIWLALDRIFHRGGRETAQGAPPAFTPAS